MSNFNSGVNAPLPLTYPDLLCSPDVDPLGQETTSDLQNLIQDVFHVLQEALGSNLDDPNRGVGLYRWLSGTNVDLAALVSTIDSQLQDDPRLDSVSSQIVQEVGSIYPWTIYVNLGVNGAIIGLSFGWSSSTGLVNITPSP